MSTILVVYQAAPNFPATDQHPQAQRFQVGASVVDAIGIAPTQAEVDAFLALTPTQVADAAAVSAAKSNLIIQFLVTHSPAECAAKVQNDVTSLATAKDMLANFAQALCVLARGTLR